MRFCKAKLFRQPKDLHPQHQNFTYPHQNFTHRITEINVFYSTPLYFTLLGSVIFIEKTSRYLQTIHNDSTYIDQKFRKFLKKFFISDFHMYSTDRHNHNQRFSTQKKFFSLIIGTDMSLLIIYTYLFEYTIFFSIFQDFSN